MTKDSEIIGFIGVGTMGMPLLDHLCKAGYQVNAFDIAEESLRKAEALGATPASSTRQVGEKSSIVILMTTNEQILSEVLLGEQGVFNAMAPGGVVIDMGTSTPARCRELAATARASSIEFLDAPVSGSVPWAATGNLAVMVGGEKPTFERCLPLFNLFGKKIFHLGPAGSGQTAKLCHQLGFMNLLVALGEAFALGTRAGIDPSQLVDVLDACVSPGHVMEFLGHKVKNNDFANDSGGITIGQKDLRAVLNLADEVSLQLPMTKMVSSFFAKAANDGYAMYDLFSTLKFAEEELFVE